MFAGIILLATVSNISGMMNAVVFAHKNQMDLAVSSVIGAATQIALLVAPALVLASLLLPTPMDLLFNRLELRRADHFRLHRQEHDDRRQVGLVGGGDAHCGLLDAWHWVFLHQLDRKRATV